MPHSAANARKQQKNSKNYLIKNIFPSSSATVDCINRKSIFTVTVGNGPFDDFTNQVMPLPNGVGHGLIYTIDSKVIRTSDQGVYFNSYYTYRVNSLRFHLMPKFSAQGETFPNLPDKLSPFQSVCRLYDQDSIAPSAFFNIQNIFGATVDPIGTLGDLKGYRVGQMLKTHTPTWSPIDSSDLQLYSTFSNVNTTWAQIVWATNYGVDILNAPLRMNIRVETDITYFNVIPRAPQTLSFRNETSGSDFQFI